MQWSWEGCCGGGVLWWRGVVELGGVSWWIGVLGVVVVEQGCNGIKMGVVVVGVIVLRWGVGFLRFSLPQLSNEGFAPTC